MQNDCRTSARKAEAEEDQPRRRQPDRMLPMIEQLFCVFAFLTIASRVPNGHVRLVGRVNVVRINCRINDSARNSAREIAPEMKQVRREVVTSGRPVHALRQGHFFHAYLQFGALR